MSESDQIERKKRLCVFCGSSSGHNPKYIQLANQLGQFMVEEGLDLVYGGATIGLMGALANSVMENGGEVHGVIPEVLKHREIAHNRLSHLYHVGTMHQRKKLMYDLSDGFLAIPGGMGTLDELCEVACWSQLQIHQKPVGILNVFDYYTPFIQQLHHCYQEGFTAHVDWQNIWTGKEIKELRTFWPQGELNLGQSEEHGQLHSQKSL